MNIFHETAICRDPPTHNFTRNKKNKLDRSLVDQHLCMLCFYENIRRRNYFVRHNVLTKDALLTQLSSNAGNLSLTNCVGYDKLLFHKKRKLDVAVLVNVSIINKYTPRIKPASSSGTFVRLYETDCVTFQKTITFIPQIIQRLSNLVKYLKQRQWGVSPSTAWELFLLVDCEWNEIRYRYGLHTASRLCIAVQSANTVSRKKTSIWRALSRNRSHRSLARWPVIDHLPHQVTTYLNVTSFRVLNWQAKWLTKQWSD
jgi:hypothetical protein